jgi:hypothetical protein
MSIYSAAIALNLALNSSPAIYSNANISSNKFSKPTELAQVTFIPLDQYDDGIQKGREQLDRLVKVVRSYPKFTARQKAGGVSKLYMQRVSELDKLISWGLDHQHVSQRDKQIIIQRWKTERDSLKRMANEEIEPYLTAKQRAFINFFNDPVKVKKLEDQIRRRDEEERRNREDAEKLRDILPR